MMQRLLPVFTLYLLAPLIAEYLSGSLSMAQLPLLLLMVPFYGSGAVLLREIARHSGRGWLALPFLGLAYGIVEEGIVDQSLFNPHFLGLRLLDFGYLPALGIGAPWTVYVLGIHILWSIAVPVALTELLFPARRTTPWLGKIGLSIVALLYVAVSAVITQYMAKQGHFWASAPQLLSSALAALAAVGLAFVIPKREAEPGRHAWPAWVIAIFAFVTGSLFILVYGQAHNALDWPWQAVAGSLLALLAIQWGIGLASQRCAHWSDWHRFAATAGGLLLYCWSGFATDIALHGPATMAAHGALVAAMLVVLGVAFYRVRAVENAQK